MVAISLGVLSHIHLSHIHHGSWTNTLRSYSVVHWEITAPGGSTVITFHGPCSQAARVGRGACQPSCGWRQWSGRVRLGSSSPGDGWETERGGWSLGSAESPHTSSGSLQQQHQLNYWVTRGQQHQLNNQVTRDRQHQLNNQITHDQQHQFNNQVTWDQQHQFNNQVTWDQQHQFNNQVTWDQQH